MVRSLDELDAIVRAVVDETRFSGVVRVDRDGTTGEWAFGLADRRHDVANTPGTRFGIASGTKGFTALTVMALVESGALDLDTPARRLLGNDLPLVDDRVTVEHLLAHRSGIGDYLDEEQLDDINEYVLPAPVHELWSTERYLTVVDGYPQFFAPGERFAYNNGGYIVLALLAERAGGERFEDLVRFHVCEPAGLAHTAFELSDQLPADIAHGYLAADGLRTNVFHLPVIGSGDGGLFSTVGDIHRLWQALFDGRIVSRDAAALMTRPHSDVPAENMRYGLGFWLDAAGPQVVLEGYDAGVSFRSDHDPETGATTTVISNTSGGAWPMARALRDAPISR
jgi:CubicO group peptidase (beta-lactamase class C family)